MILNAINVVLMSLLIDLKMEKESTEEALELPSLPIPLPTIPSNVKLESVKPPKYSIVSRSGVGTSGRKISLLANHFKVSVNAPDAVFYQYTVGYFVYIPFLSGSSL